jgi:hypothetical protein
LQHRCKWQGPWGGGGRIIPWPREWIHGSQYSATAAGCHNEDYCHHGWNDGGRKSGTRCGRRKDH